jgi:SAM-dependent methyltransferase
VRRVARDPRAGAARSAGEERCHPCHHAVVATQMPNGSRRTGAPKSWSDVVVRSFEELLDEAAEVSVEGWDFSWLDGRATEQRPSWGYQRLLNGKLAAATAALDIQTGGGEVLAGAGAESFPPTLVATEGWAPNLAKATAVLHPLGAVVVADDEEPPLPFADGAFDLVTSRHPATVHWLEVARVLAPGGTYFAQHVGGRSNVEIAEYFRGPLDLGDGRDHEVEADRAREVGLEIVQCRNERLQLEFFDVGAVVYFLRKVVWTVPDFTIDRYRSRLRELHDRIQHDGVFRSTMSRTLLEAIKPSPA